MREERFAGWDGVGKRLCSPCQSSPRMFTTMHEGKHDRVDTHAAHVDIHVDHDHDAAGETLSWVSSSAQRRDTHN